MTTETQEQILEHFQSITVHSGYNQDGCYNLDTNSPDVATRLGKLFFDYLVAAIYDTSWEGFSDQDQKVIALLLRDMDKAQRVGL